MFVCKTLLVRIVAVESSQEEILSPHLVARDSDSYHHRHRTCCQIPLNFMLQYIMVAAFTPVLPSRSRLLAAGQAPMELAKNVLRNFIKAR